MEIILSAVPTWSVLVPYTIACAVLFLTPGPDMSLFLAKTLSGGRSAGVAAVLGAMSGGLVHTTLAGVGLSAILAASTWGFMVLKVVGAVYLLWLAVDAVRNGSVLSVDTTDQKKGRWIKTYLTGVGINLTNPKIILFFVTFLPQFVSPTDPHAAGKIFFLGIYFLVFSLPLAILLILVAEKFIAFVRARPRVLRVLDWSFAGIFSVFALKILVTEMPTTRS